MNYVEHLLSCLGEEGAEIAKACSKANRFGLDDINCVDPSVGRNDKIIAEEIDDLLGVAELLREMNLLGPSDPARIEAKKRKVAKFMEYARARGRLNR